MGELALFIDMVPSPPLSQILIELGIEVNKPKQNNNTDGLRKRVTGPEQQDGFDNRVHWSNG